MANEQYKDGEKIEAGDLFKFGGIHRVIGFRALPDFHKVLPGRTARIAVCDDGFEITVIDGHGTRVFVS